MNLAKRLCSRVVRGDCLEKPTDLLRGWSISTAKLPRQHCLYFLPDASMVLMRRCNNKSTFYDIDKPPEGENWPVSIIQLCALSSREAEKAVRTITHVVGQQQLACGKYIQRLMGEPRPPGMGFHNLPLQQWEKDV